MLEGKAADVSLFLALPTEIRLRIYQYVFDGVKVFIHRAGYFSSCLKVDPGRNLLYTCRTCYNEGLEQLWSCATWVMGFEGKMGKPALPPRLDPILTRFPDKSYLAFLHHIEINDEYLTQENVLSFHHLKTLTVQMRGVTCFTKHPMTSHLLDELLYDALMRPLMKTRHFTSWQNVSLSRPRRAVAQLFRNNRKYKISVKRTFRWLKHLGGRIFVRAKNIFDVERDSAHFASHSVKHILIIMVQSLTHYSQVALINLDTGHISYLNDTYHSSVFVRWCIDGDLH
jgi:hypothetical protein